MTGKPSAMSHYNSDCRPHPPERTQITLQEVEALLNRIARHRQALATDAATLQDWLQHSEDFAAAWKRFTSAGGLTGRDFITLRRQGCLDRAPARTRRHLRLVVDHAKGQLTTT